jgi:hypothetical protein
MESVYRNSTYWIPSLHLLTYLISPWSSVLLEKLTGFQLVEKFSAIYGTRKFIAAFTSARHLSLSWASLIQSIPAHSTSCSDTVPYGEILIGYTGFFSVGKTIFIESEIITWKSRRILTNMSSSDTTYFRKEGRQSMWGCIFCVCRFWFFFTGYFSFFPCLINLLRAVRFLHFNIFSTDNHSDRIYSRCFLY